MWSRWVCRLGSSLRGFSSESVCPYREFTRRSRRTGLIAEKIGLLNQYDKFGRWHTLTVLRVENVHVVRVDFTTMKHSKYGYATCQVGIGDKKPKNATLPEIGHCAKAGLLPKRKLVDFKITPDAYIQPGTQLFARHFIAGQRVDVTGISKGKGFAGVMKRWGFKGMPASHGISKSHRGMGSTGQQSMGRVWKGKKMPGRMGGNKRTHSGMRIVRIDPVRNLIYIKGTFPGNKGSYVTIRDAVLLPNPRMAPFPTFYPWASDGITEDLAVPLADANYYLPNEFPVKTIDDDIPAPPGEQWIEEQ